MMTPIRPALPRHAHLHELDLLRGFACLVVVAFHFLARGQAAGWVHAAPPEPMGQLAMYGYLGVQLFFMISGFVIFMSAEGTDLRGFAASRAARLYPALWVAAPPTAAAAWWLQDPRFQVSGATLLLNLTLVPQWFGAEFVDGSYWSLAVELQFYLLIALALQTKLLQHIEKLLIPWLLLAALDLMRPMYPLERWLAVDYAAFFSAGICAYRIRQQGADVPRVVLMGVSYVIALGNTLRGAEKVRVQDGLALADGWTLLIVSLFFLLFILIAANRLRLPAWRWTAWAGALTYPVYLLHQNLGYLLIEQTHRWHWPLLLGIAATVAVIIALAWCVHWQVERPLGRALRNWLRGPSSRTTAGPLAAR
jgi:peptidoglycan/LPS O-acetylase OafA/YrhL